MIPDWVSTVWMMGGLVMFGMVLGYGLLERKRSTRMYLVAGIIIGVFWPLTTLYLLLGPKLRNKKQ